MEFARDRILERMQTKTCDEWMEIFHANGNVAAEPYLTPAEAIGHRDLIDNHAITEIHDPRLGPVHMIGSIANLTGTPADPASLAPQVGEHTTEVLAQTTDRKSTRLNSSH